MGEALRLLLVDAIQYRYEQMGEEVDPKEIYRLQGERRGLSWVLKCLTEPNTPND